MQFTQNAGDIATNLHLAKSEGDVTRCYGRIQGYNPIFIPRKSTGEMNHRALPQTNITLGSLNNNVQGGQKYWIRKLRSPTKSVRYNCTRCRVKVLRATPTSTLPSFRTEFTRSFSNTGVDFAGPLLYKARGGGTSKSYAAPLTCASKRAMHLRRCKDMTVKDSKQVFRSLLRPEDYHYK